LENVKKGEIAMLCSKWYLKKVRLPRRRAPRNDSIAGEIAALRSQ